MSSRNKLAGGGSGSLWTHKVGALLGALPCGALGAVFGWYGSGQPAAWAVGGTCALLGAVGGAMLAETLRTPGHVWPHKL